MKLESCIRAVSPAALGVLRRSYYLPSYREGFRMNMYDKTLLLARKEALEAEKQLASLK